MHGMITCSVMPFSLNRYEYKVLFCVNLIFPHHSGQLSSVDRDYGWAHHLTHHIGTHQIHHLFIKIPHYHLEEATTAFRQHYPHLVRICDRPILSSFVRMFKLYCQQRLIGDDTEVHLFKTTDCS